MVVQHDSDRLHGLGITVTAAGQSLGSGSKWLQNAEPETLVSGGIAFGSLHLR
ncbi:hypothetical protein O982_23750 [Mycobacterium avium 10-5581]|nr:hypothetical protein O982_23750 [Mycobacterium avium 10-5581]